MSFFFTCLAGGHAVETWHGNELRHLPISQLPVCLSAAEVCRALWTDLSEVFWDDHSTVPGLYSSRQMFYCLCNLLLVWFWDCFFFFPLQNFHKQFKEMAGVMETVWCYDFILVYIEPTEDELNIGLCLLAVCKCGYKLLQMSIVSIALLFFS